MDRKPEMIAALSARQAQEAPQLDKGDIPGDGLGAGGKYSLIHYLFVCLPDILSLSLLLDRVASQLDKGDIPGVGLGAGGRTVCLLLTHNLMLPLLLSLSERFRKRLN